MNEAAVNNEMVELNGGADQPALNGQMENSKYDFTPKESSHRPSLNFDPYSVDKSPASIEDKIPDSALDAEQKKGATPVVASSGTASASRGKKRKKAPRDATAPKQPLTGYFRFLNDRREKVRTDNPTMPFAEITKRLAAEWSSLPVDQKQQYLDAAEQDKERYNREVNDYKQTEAYRLYSEKQNAEKLSDMKKERNGSEPTLEQQNEVAQDNKEHDFSGFDIPIFTEEFLDHNKACETELRQLRKATSDYEAQNAVLQRHVDSLHAAVNRLESETSQQRATNQSLQRHLDSLRSQLAGSFAAIPLQGTHEGATLQNIDGYVERLESLLNSNVDPALRNTVRAAISRLELIG